MIRPEQVRMVAPGEAFEGSAAGGAAATVLDHRYHGPDTVVRLGLAPTGDTVVKARTLEPEPPAAGEAVELFVAGPVVLFASASGQPPAPPAVAAGDLSAGAA